MFKIVKKEIEIFGKKISLETGKIARQADGAIIAQCGETVVMATVVGAKKINPDIMIVGSDYKNKTVIGSEHAKKLIFFERIAGYSTSKIIESSCNR